MRLLLLIATALTAVAAGNFALAQEMVKSHPMDAVPIADSHIHMVDFLQNGGYLWEGKEAPPQVSDSLPTGSRHLRIELLLSKQETIT